MGNEPKAPTHRRWPNEDKISIYTKKVYFSNDFDDLSPANGEEAVKSPGRRAALDKYSTSARWIKI